MKAHISLTIVLSFILSACASSPASKNTERWTALKSSDEFKREKDEYRKRLGADICWGAGVVDFLKNPQLKPSAECLYPASKMIVEREDENGIIFKGKMDLKQNINQLKVFQVVSNGFVIDAPKDNYLRPNLNVIFIEKTDEVGIVDGSFLDDKHYWSLYEYRGPFTYQTKIGSKTVHSFKKVSLDRLVKASEGLKSYGPRKELFIENELWDRMEEYEKEKQ